MGPTCVGSRLAYGDAGSWNHYVMYVLYFESSWPHIFCLDYEQFRLFCLEVLFMIGHACAFVRVV